MGVATCKWERDLWWLSLFCENVKQEFRSENSFDHFQLKDPPESVNRKKSEERDESSKESNPVSRIA